MWRLLVVFGNPCLVLSEIRRPCLTEAGLIKGCLQYQDVLMCRTKDLVSFGFLPSHSPPLFGEVLVGTSACLSCLVCARGMSEVVVGRASRPLP